jgi:hypothetical protein
MLTGYDWIDFRANSAGNNGFYMFLLVQNYKGAPILLSVSGKWFRSVSIGFDSQYVDDKSCGSKFETTWFSLDDVVHLG